MNMSRPIGSIQTSAVTPVRVFLIGDRDRISQIIAQFCSLVFCQHIEWSDVMPQPNTGEYMSIMIKKN